MPVDSFRSLRSRCAFAGGLAACVVACSSEAPGGGGASGGQGGSTTATGGLGGAEPCSPGFADCDGDPANGCETNTQSSVEHCGACGVACQSGPYSTPVCVAGACSAQCEDGFENCNDDLADGCEQAANSACGAAVLTLAAGQGGPFAIAVDESCVYWINNNASQFGEVMKVALGGGTPVTLATSQGNVQDLAVGPSGAYWTDFDEGVMRVDLGGGAPSVIDSDPGAQGITLDASNVYWTQSVGYGDVMQAPLSGGPPTALASQQDIGWRIAVDEQHAYWTRHGMDLEDGAVVRVSLAGGSPELLVSGQPLPEGIAVDETSVYWTNAGTQDNNFADGSVMKMSLTGDQVTTLASNQPWPTGIAVDETSVYWTNADGGTVMKVPPQGGDPIVVAAQQPGPFDIAVDATSVYWVNVGGSVQAVPK